MSSNDDLTYHPVTIGADNANLQAGGLSSITDAITKGAPAAAISGALSIWNTARDFAGKDVVDTQEFIGSVNESWGNYYADHKEGVDLAGFVATSIVPGMAGVKALQLARAGLAGTRGGAILNFTASGKEKYLKAALAETGKDGVVGNILSANRRKLLGYATADSALEATAAELMIAATMNDSPVFNDATAGDFAWNIALGASFGGVIGGAFQSITAKGVLKNAVLAIEKEKRAFDVVDPATKSGLDKGTQTLILAEQIEKLSKDVADIKFSYTWNGAKSEATLESSNLLAGVRDRAKKSAVDELQLKFNTLAGDNANIGQAYFQMITKGVQAAKEAGRSADESIEMIAGYLNHVDNIGPINLAKMDIDNRKFYVSTEPTNIFDAFVKKQGPGTSKTAYILGDGITSADLNVAQITDYPLGTRLNDIARGPNAPDVIMRGAGNRPFVNPYSKKVARVSENPSRIRMLVDLDTATVSPEGVVHFADIVDPKKLVVGVASIEAGGRVLAQAASKAADFSLSAIDGSARFAWASKLDVHQFDKLTGGVIDGQDLPMLTRALELGKSGHPDLKINVNGQVLGQSEVAAQGGLVNIINEQKHLILEEQLAKYGAYDTRHLAAHMNESVEWVEGAIARNFVPDPQNVGAFTETADAFRPKTAYVEWDFSDVKKSLDPQTAYDMQFGPKFGAAKELDRFYRMEANRMVQQNAADFVLGADAKLFMEPTPNLAKTADKEGAGAKLFGASNAGYEKNAVLWAQDTGAALANYMQKKVDETISALSPAINSLRTAPQIDQIEFGVLTTALRNSSTRYVVSPLDPQQLVSTEFMKAYERLSKAGGVNNIRDVLDILPDLERGQHTMEIKSKAVMDFLQQSTNINAKRQSKLTALYNAVGLNKSEAMPGSIYVPPIDTVRYPYHAFVRTKNKVGVGGETTMITAKDQTQLELLASRVDKEKFDVFFKKDTDNYFKIKGEYDYEMTLNSPRIDSELRRTGALSDHFPETRFTNVMEDWLGWHRKQEEKVARTAIETKYRQTFSELRFMSENFRTTAESVSRGIGSAFKSKVQDPFGDYVKTALNISKQNEFPLLDSFNEFIDKVGLKAGEALARARSSSPQPGMAKPWEEADKIARDFGLGMPYSMAAGSPELAYMEANSAFPKNLIREAFQKGNMLLANFTLRLDFLNGFVNTLSTPIMLGTEMASIRRSLEGNAETAGLWKELTTLQVPGKDIRTPSMMKLGSSAIGNFFGPEKQALMQRYRDIGAVKDVTQIYHQMLDDISFDLQLNPAAYFQRVNSQVDKLAKFTGNDFLEDLTRFVTADIARQMSDPLVKAGKMSLSEQNAVMRVFVNRVQGNYVTSQRPVVFQGTTGAAVSLFQTYAFNVLQQLYRHMEAGDKKTLAVFAGLQSTVFGLNGLPFFDAVNKHLIGSMIAGNDTHKDAYSVLPSFNKEAGDWLLYGTASAFPLFGDNMPALYTRGDINPRHLTILPTNPLDIPIVQAGIRVTENIVRMGKDIAKGADMSDALLAGLEHNGVSRPLAGFAQVLGGRSTTSTGALVSAANDWQSTSWLGSLKERMIDFGGVSRMMGARPMDESVALNNMFRQKHYDALDKARIESLGRVVKTKFYDGDAPSSEELAQFAEDYAAAGGHVDKFSQAMQRWMKQSSVSVVNQTMENLNSRKAQRMMEVMGGERLTDYENNPD